MIGTEAMAKKAKSFSERLDNDPWFSTLDLPHGWSIVGEGAYRVAYLGPDGVVYKVQHDSESGKWDENLEEWQNGQLYSDKVREATNGKARLAECDYFSDCNVIAMEYVPRERNSSTFDWLKDCYIYAEGVKPLIKAIKKVTDITDLHSDNCWFGPDGILTVIDYNC
jgi:hypothetical protein